MIKNWFLAFLGYATLINAHSDVGRTIGGVVLGVAMNRELAREEQV